MKILVVEDDLLLLDGITQALSCEGYACDAVMRNKEMLTFMKQSLYSLIILDIGLPDGSGLDSLSKIRQEGIVIPVLILTARDRLDDKVKGLDAGADDYLIKPFELKELFARVRALVRRSEGIASSCLTYRNYVLDMITKSVLVDNKPIDLTPKEYSIFQRLFLRAGNVVAREQLLNDLYAWNDDFGSNTLEVYIHNLRAKLGKASIVTLRGQGYRLE